MKKKENGGSFGLFHIRRIKRAHTGLPGFPAACKEKELNDMSGTDLKGNYVLGMAVELEKKKHLCSLNKGRKEKNSEENGKIDPVPRFEG